MIEENCFWWVLLWDCFVVDSVFFLHVVASVLVGGKVVQCLTWFEVVFLFIWWFFFNDLMKYNHGFFCEILCLVSLRRGRFFSCWFVKKVFVEWIGSFVAWVVGEFCLLLIEFFSCTWLLLFLWAGRFCNVLSDLSLFFYSFDYFFPMIWWNTITVFFCEIFCVLFL